VDVPSPNFHEHFSRGSNCDSDGWPVSINRHANPFSGTQTNTENLFKMWISRIRPYVGNIIAGTASPKASDLDLDYEIVAELDRKTSSADQFTSATGVESPAAKIARAPRHCHLEGSRREIILDVPVQGSLVSAVRVRKSSSRRPLTFWKKPRPRPLAVGAMFGGAEELGIRIFVANADLTPTANRNDRWRSVFARPA